MSKAIPTISKYMTVLPHSIGDDQTLEKADTLMREHHIRHLPVLSGGKLVGIVSQRDIDLVRSFGSKDSNDLRVSDAAHDNVFTVAPDTKLNEVVRRMAGDKLGSALVVDNGKLVGIFTDTDALSALDELLVTRLTH